MNNIKFFLRTILLVLLSMKPVGVIAQASVDELLDGYVSASVSEESTSPYITKINQIYKNYRNDQQAELRTKIYEMVVGDTIAEQNRQKEKFALIDLYAFLTDSNDEKLDDLLFKKGEICALQTGDTIMLKECITSLKLSNHSKTPAIENYVNTLQDYLEEIRNYLPVSQRIDGVWVSNSMSSRFLDMPMIVLNINQGKMMLEVVDDFIRNYKYWGEIELSEEQNNAQNIIDIGREKVYLLWSSEKLNIPNQEVAFSLGQAASDIATEITRKAISNIIGKSGGNIVGGLAGNIVGGIVTGLFAPIKKIFVLEMNLEKVNDAELRGHYSCQIIKICGSSTPEISKREDDVIFIKYDIESGAFFKLYGNSKKYVPGFDFSNGCSPQYENKFRELVNKYEKGGLFKTKRKWGFFAPHQIKKLIYFTEQNLLQQGYRQEDLCYGNCQTAMMGIMLENRTGKEIKIPKDMKGVYVYDVLSKYDPWHAPAFLFGIKEGDIIISVDGYEMDSPQKFVKYIQSLNPYDWATVHIKRGSKEMDIEVELTWK